MFLDNTYFQGELYIPNLQLKTGNPAGIASVVNQTVAENTLEWFVGKYEQECLSRILGCGLYRRFIAGLEDEAGEGYEDWVALKDRIFVKKWRYGFSPVANYVYFFLMRSSRSQTTTSGEVKMKIDNTTVVSDSAKLIKAWNDMGSMIEEIHAFINANAGKYGRPEDISHCWFKPVNSFGI